MNIILDGNLEIFRALHVVSDFGRNTKFMEQTEDEIEFVRKVLYDMCSIDNAFGNGDRVIVVFDSKGSWRKSILIEENDGYKSTRQKSDHVDWNRFFAVVEEMQQLLRDKGIPVLQIPRAEGDDLLYLTSHYSRSQGENSVLVTTDKDIHQCVYQKGDVFSLVYGGTSQERKLLSPPGFQKWLRQGVPFDIFNSNTFSGRTGREIIQRALSRQPIKLVEIDPAEMIFAKIIAGDRGDAVPPVLRWKNKTNPDKKWGATDKKAATVWERMGPMTADDLMEDADLRREVARVLIEVCKCKDEADVDETAIKIMRNIRLVYLSHDTIPPAIIDEFDSLAADALAKPKPHLLMESLTAGTRFERDETPQSRVSDSLLGLDDIFKDINP